LLVLGLVLAACSTESPQQKAAVRLQKAEAAMTECKQRVGLGDMPTPDTVVLADPATRGAEMTPEGAALLRLKVQCRLELDELLAARREAGR
jgi:hypothetical protein